MSAATYSFLANLVQFFFNLLLVFQIFWLHRRIRRLEQTRIATALERGAQSK